MVEVRCSCQCVMNGRLHYCTQRPCVYCTLLGHVPMIWEMVFRYRWCIHFKCSSEQCMWVSEIFFEPKQTWDCDDVCPLGTARGKNNCHLFHPFNTMKLPWDIFFLYTLRRLSLSGALCCNCVAGWNESWFRDLIKSEAEETLNMRLTRGSSQKTCTAKGRAV